MRRWSNRSSVKVRHIKPRPYFAMKLIASGVTFSAASIRSPSFSRSSSSTMTIMRPATTSSTALGTSVNGVWPVTIEIVARMVRERDNECVPHEAAFFMKLTVLGDLAAAQLRFQPSLHLGPLRIQNAEVNRIPLPPVPCEHVLAQRPFFFCSQPQNRLPGPLVQSVSL